jgi:hypothetical protein
MPATAIDFIEAGNQRLNATIAALLEFDTSLQAPMLKQYIEHGLDRLQALEEEHYTFLSECAMLAANNMQDIRLRDLEQRVTDIETPPPETWGETLLGIVTDIAIQMAVLATLETGAGLVIAFLGKRAVGNALRAAATSWKPNTAKQELLRSYDSLRNSKKIAENASQALEQILEKIVGGKVHDKGFEVTIDFGQTRTINNMNDWNNVAWELGVKEADLDTKLYLAKKAMSENNERVLDAYKSGDEAIQKYSHEWRDFIGGERGNLLITPTYTLISKVITNVANAGSGTGATPFLSSSVTGGFLKYASFMRLQIAEAYSSMRSYVRYASDSALKTDEQIMALAQLIATALPSFNMHRLIAQAVRLHIVMGFEGMYWFEYFKANGALEIQPNVTWVGGSKEEVGTFIDGFIIKARGGSISPNLNIPLSLFEARTQMWATSYSADFYCGVTIISELQAEYLYHRFAKPYFRGEQNEAAANLPFTYEEENYKYLSAEQPELWKGHLTSVERKQRLNEMRLMVIIFFNNFRNRTPDERMNDFIGEAVLHAPVDEAEHWKEVAQFRRGIYNWPDGLSIGIAPKLVDANEATLKALEAAREPLEALLAELNVGSQLQTTALIFADMLTDLNQDIVAYQLLKSGHIELRNPADHRTEADLLFEIENEQIILTDKYRQLMGIAVKDPVTLEFVVGTYQDAYDAVTQWKAGHDWVWYGASPTNP